MNAVSKRLAALGAMTKGERHSLSSDLFRPEDVTDEYGKAALARLYGRITSGQHNDEGLGIATLERMGVLDSDKARVRENYVGNVEQFLNRIMVLQVDEQNRVFELFYGLYLEAVEAAKRQSAFDFGVEELRARNLHRVGAPELLFTDSASGARTMLHELEGVVDIHRNTFEAATESAKIGFFRNKRSGHVYAVSKHWDTERREVMLTGVKNPRRSLEPEELQEKYERIKAEEAAAWWQATYANTPATEPRRFHLLSGAVFPIYDKVMGSSGVQNVKISRARLADGESLVGVNLSPIDVPNVKQRLGIGTPLGQASAQEILGLLEAGSPIELDNGWQLTRARILGEQVVELVLNGVPANRDELQTYGFSEEIIHFKRRWFAMEGSIPLILRGLLNKRKPVRVSTNTVENHAHSNRLRSE